MRYSKLSICVLTLALQAANVSADLTERLPPLSEREMLDIQEARSRKAAAERRNETLMKAGSETAQAVFLELLARRLVSEEAALRRNSSALTDAYSEARAAKTDAAKQNYKDLLAKAKAEVRPNASINPVNRVFTDAELKAAKRARVLVAPFRGAAAGYEVLTLANATVRLGNEFIADKESTSFFPIIPFLANDVPKISANVVKGVSNLWNSDEAPSGANATEEIK